MYYDDWWEYEGGNNCNKDSDCPPAIPKESCRHEFIPVLLLRTTVYDCKLCGKHKEDVENEKRTT